MVRRHKKRSRKYLGNRRWGGGNIKRRRNKGSRGGRGMYAGGHKHRWSWILRYEPEHYGRHGFVPPTSERVEVINLRDISALAASGKLKEEGGKFAVELGGAKVLGNGRLSVPVIIKAKAFSKAAEEAIKKAGGEAVRV
jgi:large subunit ribosomal protein L15